MTKNTQFDALDYQIILELRQDARKSASEIARSLHANERTIRNRIDRLVESGAVRLTSILDPIAFGYINTVDIFLVVDPDQEQSVINQLLYMQEVSYLAYGFGTQEISIEARFKDNAEMRTFLGRVLPAIAGVRVKGYALVPRILRNIDEWLPRPEDFSR
ncbi:MAG: AsnC family transcriptional regulator [Chloroflexota bacterium]|jgi:DNA-binding Lrp family transcriptional regulator